MLLKKTSDRRNKTPDFERFMTEVTKRSKQNKKKWKLLHN